jgi:uncharacterized membrane protein (UPF0182 family)
MPELRLVVLALQDRLAYGPTFEVAMAALFGNGQSTLATAPNAPSAPNAPPTPSAPAPSSSGQAPPASTDVNGLISAAAKDLADYQRLTAEGKLGEAGQKLEALKQKLELLNRSRR